MAIWLIRTGSHGEYEQKFIQEKRVYVTWSNLDLNLAHLSTRADLTAVMSKKYSDRKPKTIQNWVGQVWPFAHEIKKGDLVIVPLKSQPAIQIGEITGDYHFEPEGPNPFFHWRSVKWIAEAIPRSNFAQDLLFTFGAFMTICRVQRNNAEARIAAMHANNWKPEPLSSITRIDVPATDDGEAYVTNVEEVSKDQIAQLIMAHFKGNDLSRLVEAILKAQGYETYLSPPGRDGGRDILAGAAPLGFGMPRLCVQVKSEDSPIDREKVDGLIGNMSKSKASEGLFVSWSGFRSTVQKELAQSFFDVRLWTQKELLEALFANYDRMDDDIKAELPLKRIWAIATPEEE